MPAPQADYLQILEEFGAKSAIFAGMGGGMSIIQGGFRSPGSQALGYHNRIFEFQAVGVSMKVV